MKIDYIHEQGNGILNEDKLVLNGDTFGVLDGATCLNKIIYDNGKTGGYLASNIAGKIFETGNGPLKDLTCQANSAIYDEMATRGIDTSEKINLWSTSAAVVRIEKDSFEWVQTGDSLILAIYEDNSYRVLVDDYNHDRETLLMWKDISADSDRPVHEALRDQIRKVRSQMNITYGVINGERETLDFIKNGRENLESLKHLVIFTDGLTLPRSNPDGPDNFGRFVELYLEGGLNHLKDYIRHIEKSDPECRVYPRFKKHDDIAAVSISF